VRVLTWDSIAARDYGAIRANLESQGQLMGSLDTIIEAYAFSVGAVMVTHDKAFNRISGLKVVDWTL
jgi:tRNA(fMet)-specific endonuclease VapC